jgi:hypothetical protein
LIAVASIDLAAVFAGDDHAKKIEKSARAGVAAAKYLLQKPIASFVQLPVVPAPELSDSTGPIGGKPTLVAACD